MSRRALLVAALVVGVVLVAVAFALGRYETYLTGFWEADSQWARAAGVDAAFLTLAAPASRWGAWTTVRPGYLVMTRDGETVYNGAIELAYRSWASRGWSAAATPAARYAARVTLTEKPPADDAAPVGGAPNSVLPAALSLTLSMTEGSLALHTSDTLWGMFYKNFEASISAQTG